MLTYTVILTLTLNAAYGMGNNGFRLVVYPRSLDSTQNQLQSPCPDVFQYQYDEYNNLYGTIRVDQTDGTGYVRLDVELAVGNAVQGFNGLITLAEDREKVKYDVMNRKPIHYRVQFPAWENYPPRITKITVNGNLICSGPRMPIQSVRVWTQINLQNTLRVVPEVVPLLSSLDSTTEDSTSQVNNVDNGNLFDVRSEASPSSNVFAVNRPPPPPPGDRRPPPPHNPFFNGNNPYGFNPPGPPPRGPPPDQRPFDQRPPPNRNPVINPQNPFFAGLTTAEPPRGGQEDSNGPSVIIQPTLKPASSLDSSNINEVCGRPLPINQLVVNGQSVSSGAYPWLVAIFRQKEDALSLNYICSGSLISNRHVITAAHCLKLEYRRVKPNEIVCVFGKLNIRRWNEPGLIREPETITIHPDYHHGNASADIAMITFSDPITFSRTILPLCLWQGPNDINQIVGNIGTVVGWGRTESGDLSSAEPRQVNMPIVDQVDCVKNSSPLVNKAFLEIISHTTFCAGARNGTGPCNGDSGSAFLLRKNGVFYLRGIVSIALSDSTSRLCNLNEYIVFTDASKYLDWIRNTMNTT